MANETVNETQAAASTAGSSADHSPWDFNISHGTSENVQVHGGTVTDTSREQTDVHAHVSDYFAHAVAGSDQSTTMGLNQGFEHTHDAFQNFDIHEVHPGSNMENHFTTSEHSAPAFEPSHHDAFSDTHHAPDAFAAHGGHDTGAGHAGNDHGGQSHDQGIGGM